MAQRPPQVRLYVYEASQAPLAVILRRGPSRHTRMILWDRRDDRFTDGQWTKNKIYYDRCAIAPDGRHFLYFMLDGKWDSAAAGSYTAICRPPFFTALALHPQGDTWGGGGQFHSRDSYSVHAGGDDIIGQATGLSAIPWRETAAPAHDPDPACQAFGTEAGRLLALTQAQDGSWRKTLVRDFTDMVFEPIPAPDAAQAAGVPR